MSYEKLVDKVKKAYAKVDASKISEHIAVQYNVYSKGEGAFYIEIADGKINVEPYEYYDRDATVIIAGELLEEIVSGKKEYAKELAENHFQIVGNVGKANVLIGLEFKKAAKKAATKTAATTKTAAKKTTTKTAASKTTKTATKTATKKATTTKTTAKKTTAKAEETKAAEVKAAETKAVEASKEVAKKEEVKPVAKAATKTTKSASKTK